MPAYTIDLILSALNIVMLVLCAQYLGQIRDILKSQNRGNSSAPIRGTTGYSRR